MADSQTESAVGAQATRGSRRRARELAFRALFQAERSGEPLADVWANIRDDFTEQTPGEAEEAYGDRLDAAGLVFAERLVQTFAAHQAELDGQLARALEGWTFSQMSQTDLAVLRLALTELTFENLPPEVTFEVAVRIAKRYGGEESGRFVNGVLARLHRELSGDFSAPPSGAATQADETPVDTRTDPQSVRGDAVTRGTENDELQRGNESGSKDHDSEDRDGNNQDGDERGGDR